MKMSFSCTRFAAILFCLTAIVVLSFADLIVLRHPPEGWYKTTRKLTCYSEDDDSALVWNYDYEPGEEDNTANFQPKKSGLNTDTNCAIWKSEECVANWEKSYRWDLVNSAKKPTGPVLDYRWEGFKEFVLSNGEELRGRNIGKYSGTVVFSVRTLEDFNVLLCHDEEVIRSQCFWIRIGYSWGKQSNILTCVKKPLNFSESHAERGCTQIADTSHETPVVNTYEWRTFRIEWKSEKHTIKLFEETEVDPFLQGTVKQWHSVPYIFIRSEISSRVRFHFYDYYWTQTKNTELSTETFDPENEDLCVELLVGLCPDCQLYVHLIDEKGQYIAGNNISGDKSSANSVPLFWKRITLDARSKSPMPKLVRLKIGTIFDDNEGEGQWAVDSFRMCESQGGLRKSTITTYQRNQFWPRVKCQKLSYSKGAVVDLRSTSTIGDDTSKFLTLVRTSVSSDSNRSLGEKWSICDPTGCACDRGYAGNDCQTECEPGFYGHNCNKTCGSCYKAYCDGADGRCASTCESYLLVPPLCKKVERPIIEDITNTTARILEEVTPELLEYVSNFRFIVTRGAGIGSVITRTSSRGSIYTVLIKGLHPGSTYSGRAYVSTNVSGIVTEAPSPEIIFVTSLQSCFEVELKSSYIVLKLRQDLEGCEVGTGSALPGGNHYVELREKSTETLSTFVIPHFPHTFENLQPYTEYKLTVYEAGGTVILWTSTVRTLQSAPEKVRYMFPTYLSDTEITFEWTAPLRRNGIIVKYSVSIKRLKLLACENFEKETPIQDDITKEVNGTVASFSGLNPYAIYVASVIAHTTEPGMEEFFEFQTPERDIPTSSVESLELVDNQTRLRWERPEDCLKITGSTKFTRLDITNLNDLAQNPILFKTSSDYCDVYTLGLAPYTLYNVRAYVLRDSTGAVNHTLYQEKNWTTAPAAPSAVKTLELYDADLDASVISLRWVPPNPPNGEIESYHVKIDEVDPLKEWTVNSSEGKEACEPWKNYVCMKNLSLHENARYQIVVQIYARNKGVQAAGNSSSFRIFPSLNYDKAPGEPSDLTSTCKGHSDVIFTWMHPSFSPSKITRFEITIYLVESDLLENPSTRYPRTVNYTVTENQKYYAKMVTLEPSTKYNVFVVAVNRRNQKSRAIETELSVPTGVGFADKNESQVTFDGMSIGVTIPTIDNPTLNTTLKVIVKGLSRCRPVHPKKSAPPVELPMSVMEWVAVVYQAGVEIPKSLQIDTDQFRGYTLFCSLDLAEEYTIVFNVTDWYSGTSILTTTSPIALLDHKESQKSNLAWLAILPAVVALCLLVIFVWRRNRQKVPRQLKMREPSYVEPIPASSEMTTTVRTSLPTIQNTGKLKPSIPRRPSYLEILPSSSTSTLTDDYTALNTPKIASHPTTAKNRPSAHLYMLPTEPDSCSVSIEDFDKYVKNAATSELLYSQFMRLRVGLTSACEYGRLPENMPKNRSENLIAYDDTRVVLEKLSGDPHSDYINASYIRGYKNERAYIAAQGPTPNTVNDFWRMVWEQKVGVICMLTNVTEGTETKCEKYWPDVGTRVKHGDFFISNIVDQVFADYTFRTFELNFQQKTRKVTHLHYTGWPSLGVPKNPQSLVAYLRKVEQTPTGNSPILVHCSTGDDRTGTLILCDICVRQGVVEKVIDVIAVASRMRNSRANMVGTLQQYVLAHIIITESSVSSSTQIACSDVLSSRTNELRIRLPSDIQRLEDTSWQEQVLQSSALTEPPILDHLTNGRPEKICDDVFEKQRNQINAVSVDGVKVNKQNLACWLPSPLTLSDFWEFVAERDVKLIIILQCSDPGNPSCYDIIPDGSIVLPTLRIEMKNSLDSGEYFTKEKLLLIDTSEEDERSQTVTVLTCRGWGCGTVQKPPKPPALISLWRASETIPRKEGQSLVLCHDGITGCGLYLALSFLLERMTVERECDVIAAVRAVRRSKPEFVQSIEQIEYLYDAAVNYVESFQTYANFC